MSKQRLVGINHVAIEVDDVDAAVAFYTDLFDVRDVAREPGAAFLDLGDQFIALMDPSVESAHFGLVVEDKAKARQALEDAGVEILPGPRLDFLDPWGNRVQVVQYDQIQFTKTDRVLAGLGLELGKSEAALAELRANDLAD
jgi:catechol 2,3-dioxygenase-like lactoylglutathione lyase family enzyme